MASASGVNLKRENPSFEESFQKKGRSDHIVASRIRFHEVFKSDVKHSFLIKIAQAMGYTRLEDLERKEDVLGGCCAGITSMGNFAILVDQVAQFNQRLLRIKAVYESVRLASTTVDRHQHEFIFNRTGVELSRGCEFRAFFDGVIFCQSAVNGSLVLGIDGKELTGEALKNTIFSYIQSVELEKKGGVEKKFATTLVADFFELRDYVSKLIGFFEKNQVYACINFSIFGHVLSMGYDPKKNIFYINDSNHLLIKTIATLDETLETMYREITDQKEKPDQFDISKKIVTGLQVVTIKGAIKLPPPHFLDGLSDEQIRDKASYRNKDNISLAGMAASIGDKSTVEKLIRIDADVKGVVPLQRACVWGHLDLLQMIVEGPRATTENGFYGMNKPFRIAIKKGHFELVKYLIDQGISIHSQEPRELSYIALAAKYGHLSLVQLFLEKKAKINALSSCERKSPLHYALLAFTGPNSLQIVKLLIDAGADVNAETSEGLTPLHIAACEGSSLCLQMLIEAGAKIDHVDEKGKTALHKAVSRAREDSVRVLLDCGANFEYETHKGDTALTVALKNGNLRIAQMLLKAGGDINKEDSFGICPLLKAVASGDLNMGKFLVELGANKDVEDFRGKSLIFVAIESKNFFIVNYLITSGFDIEKKDPEGLTPFLYAIKIGDLDMVKLLIKLKANVLGKDREDSNALSCAIRYKHDHIRSYLLSRKWPKGFVGDSLKHIASTL